MLIFRDIFYWIDMSEVWFTCDVDAAMADRIEQCNQWNGQAISDAYGNTFQSHLSQNNL